MSKMFVKLFVLIMVSLLLTACSSGGEIYQLSFSDAEGNAILDVFPNRDESNLKVVYSIPDDVEGVMEGVVGADFYTQFESIEAVLDTLSDNKDGHTSLSVGYTMMDSDGVPEVSTLMAVEGDSEELLRTFYVDVVNLLTEASPV